MAPPNGLMLDRKRPAVMRRPAPTGAPAVPQPESMAGTDGMDKALGDMTQRGMPKAPTGGQPGGNGLMLRRAAADGKSEELAPVTMDREGNAVPGVSGRLQTLVDSDSPYIRRARTRAKQAANRRGLMASSIAAGAGEGAAIDAALPIAQADASIAAGERAMRSQEFQQLRSIRSQELMQQKGFDHDTAMREADRDLSKLLQARDHRVQQLMQHERLDHDAAQRQADRELQWTMQSRLFEHQSGMQTAGFEFQGGQAALDRETRRIMQETGLDHDAAQRAAQRRFQTRETRFAARHASQEATRQRRFAGEQAGLDREQQRDLQRGTVEASERLAQETAVRDINSEYQRQITALSLNTNIPIEERRRLEDHYAFVRDQSMAGLAQIYDFAPEWTSARRP